MADKPDSLDPMALLRSFWSNAGVPLPGMMTPIPDLGELDKRIADMKAVEGWLKLNLGMLQVGIQGLELQRASLAAMGAAGDAAAGTEHGGNPFANPNLWPWNLTPATGQDSAGPGSAEQPSKP